MADSRKLAMNPALSSTCLTIYRGSETFQLIDGSSGEPPFKARWSVILNWWSGSGQSEEDSDDSDEQGLGISPRPVGLSFPSPRSMIRLEYGLESAKGLGRGRWEVEVGVQARAPCGVFQIY